MSMVPYPAFGGASIVTIFRSYLRDSAGSNDMGIATPTAASPHDFFVQADEDNDRWIKSVSFVVSANGADLREFGNGAALPDPIHIVYDHDDGEFVIADDIATNFDLIRLCAGNPAFGSSPSSMRMSNAVSATEEAYIPVLDFGVIFGLHSGLRLRAGSKQRLTIRLRDDTSAAATFNAIAYGFNRKEHPDAS